MKKITIAAALFGIFAALAATPALAADMLVKNAPPPQRAPAWSWTGFYVGVNLGGGWTKTDWLEDEGVKSVLIGRTAGPCSAFKPTPMPLAFAARQAVFRK